jgi:hypothetical protein
MVFIIGVFYKWGHYYVFRNALLNYSDTLTFATNDVCLSIYLYECSTTKHVYLFVCVCIHACMFASCVSVLVWCMVEILIIIQFDVFHIVLF